MDYLKQIVHVDIGAPPGIAVGTVKDYINLSELETAKLLYKRVNFDRDHTNWKGIDECKEHAKEIRGEMCRIKIREKAYI